MKSDRPALIQSAGLVQLSQAGSKIKTYIIYEQLPLHCMKYCVLLEKKKILIQKLNMLILFDT